MSVRRSLWYAACVASGALLPGYVLWLLVKHNGRRTT
jgi:hypothetical protein